MAPELRGGADAHGTDAILMRHVVVCGVMHDFYDSWHILRILGY